MYFYMKSKRGEKLRNYHEEAQEMYYRVSQTDDPSVNNPGTRIAHAAMVRAEGQIQAGATHWTPGKKWDSKAVD